MSNNSSSTNDASWYSQYSPSSSSPKDNESENRSTSNQLVTMINNNSTNLSYISPVYPQILDTQSYPFAQHQLPSISSLFSRNVGFNPQNTGNIMTSSGETLSLVNHSSPAMVQNHQQMLPQQQQQQQQYTILAPSAGSPRNSTMYSQNYAFRQQQHPTYTSYANTRIEKQNKMPLIRHHTSSTDIPNTGSLSLSPHYTDTVESPLSNSLHTTNSSIQMSQASSSSNIQEPAYANNVKTPTFTLTQTSNKPARERKKPTAYNIYYKEEFQNIRKELPDATISDLSREIASRWRAMNKSEQLKYYEQYKSTAELDRKTKRPLNAYHLFCKEKFEQIKREMPDGDVASWSRVAGSMWKQLSKQERNSYYQLANVGN
jgi:hypothetical protein